MCFLISRFFLATNNEDNVWIFLGGDEKKIEKSRSVE